jgi:hypothetical protein
MPSPQSVALCRDLIGQRWTTTDPAAPGRALVMKGSGVRVPASALRSFPAEASDSAPCDPRRVVRSAWTCPRYVRGGASLSAADCRAWRRPAATSSVCNGSAGWSGTRSTASARVARSRGSSGRRGRGAAGRRPATSRAAWPSAGCPRRCSRSGRARCRRWPGHVPSSPLLRPSGCATSSTIAGASPPTLRGYQTLLRTHVLPEFGAQLLTDTTTEHIERWVWGIDCSPATRAKLIVCLSGTYRRARRV